MTTINTIEDLFKLLDENPQWTEALRARLLTRDLIELPEKFAQFVDATNQRFTEVDRRFDRLEATVNSMRDDLGVLKGAHAENSAVKGAVVIARNMGFFPIRVLTPLEIGALIQSQDTSDIPNNILNSFLLADMIMEVTGPGGETGYIAVEVSYTVNGRDTSRAIRNAGFLTRFTRKPAYAAVAGLYRDDRVADIIQAGEVYWHEMESWH